MRIKLKKLFGKNKELNLILKNLSDFVGSPIQITDSNNTQLLEAEGFELTHRFPLDLDGEILGWVSGNKQTKRIVPFLNFLIAGEAREKLLADEVLNAYREITLLYNVSEKLTASLKIKHVMQVALSEASRLIKGTSGVVMLATHERDKEVPLSHFGSQKVINNNCSLGKRIIGLLDQKSKAEIVNNLHADPRFSNETYHLHSLVWAPLKTKSNILGIIMIGHDGADNEYSARDLGLLNTIASQTAPTVEKAAHYESLEKLVEERTLELSEAKDIAEMASQAKTRFLANMSHELRTPLNALLGYSQILKQEKGITEKQKDGLDIIQRSGEHLLTLINDILDLSKIEAGKMELSIRDYNFKEMLSSLTQLFQFRAVEKKISFECIKLTPLPDFVHGDEVKLRQILINLLSNAIKFTEKGGIVLKVGAADGNLRFEVEDTGIGIASDDLTEIFQSFRQIPRKDQVMEGTGLGLAISHKLVQMMGSELNVTSQLGEGSAFWFELNLPVAEDIKPEENLNQPRIDGYEGPTLKILVIEDKSENRSVLINLLAPLGFQVHEAIDGLDGIKKATEFRPDLILMDLVMPVMDGFESIRRIRQTPTGRNVCIIALSASVFESNRQATIEAGGDDFLPKPVHADQLFEIIARHLKIKWQYKTDVTVDSERQFNANSMIPPPEEQLQILFEFVKQGNIRGIRQEIDRIEQLNERFLPFVNQLRKLAKNFNMKQICYFLEPYLEKTK